MNKAFDPEGGVLLVLTVPKDSDDSSSNSASWTGQAEELEVQSAQPSSTTHNGASASSAEDVETEEVEVLVSSRHLALASRVFRIMFDGNFREKITPGRTGLRRVPLPEDNHEAMMVLLRIIHGQNGKVPRAVSRALLVEIAGGGRPVNALRALLKEHVTEVPQDAFAES